VIAAAGGMPVGADRVSATAWVSIPTAGPRCRHDCSSRAAARTHQTDDSVNALWGLLDMTPEGRGQFMPKLAY